MQRMRFAIAGIAILALACLALPAMAQRPTWTRGTVEAVSGTTLTVKSRTGETVTLTLTDKTAVVQAHAIPMDSIKTGSYIGTAALPQSDGSFKAQEVLVFPEAMRGRAEGHFPHDLTPDSTMTNGNVDALVQGASGRELTVSYKGGSTKIVVPEGAPVVTFAGGDKALLVPGAKVVVIGPKAPDGGLIAGTVIVGKDGLMPPM